MKFKNITYVKLKKFSENFEDKIKKINKLEITKLENVIEIGVNSPIINNGKKLKKL